MTAPLITVDAGAPLVEVLMQFLGGRLHHLPVRNEDEIVGLVNHTDLLRHQSRSPSFLLRKALRGETRREPGAHVREVAHMIDGLGWGGLAAAEVARVVAAVNDGLIESLLRDAERELGPAPCAYSWIVFGSEGRREQLLATDQDNALIYSEACQGGTEYFPKLARFVVDGLIEAGFPECKGGFMATNWCHSLDHWIRTFHSWIEEPDPQALMDVANFFDFRAIHGGLDLSSLEQVIADAGRNTTFLAQLAKASLSMRPPIGLFNRIKQGSEGLNLKAAGLMPVVGLARVYGLECGTHERSTLGRLRVAREKGVLSAEGADLLEQGFRFLIQLRLRVQIEAVRQKEAPGNFVRLESLEKIDARHLKETLLEIRTMQQALAQRHRVELLG
jgi:CBS domain-containing protein